MILYIQSLAGQIMFIEYGMIHNHNLIVLFASVVIYIPSKQCLYLCGGHFGTGDSNTDADTIHSYNIITQKWQKQIEIKLPTPLFSFGHIVTDNDLILFGGGIGDDKYSDAIHILNLQTMKWRQSCVRCPTKGRFYAIKMSNCVNEEFVVFGFIRSNNIGYFPVSLINVIKNWYCNDYVYLMQHYYMDDNNNALEEKGRMWKMSVDRILSDE